MSHPGRSWLLGAGLLSLGIAALHVGIIVAGPAAYTYFGAGDLAPLAAAGSPVPALLTGALVLLFAIAGAYALSGARVIGRMPLLAPGLVAIGAIYVLRGLALGPELLALARGTAGFPPRYAVFSLVSLLTGLAYVAGTWRAWAALRSPRAADAI